jgi:hypothetical protein
VAGLAWREQWLYASLDPAAKPGMTIDVPPAFARFYEDELRNRVEQNAFIAFYQGELRRRYAGLSAQSGDVRTLEAFADDFYGALGAVEGLLASRQGYPLRQAVRLLQAAAERMPPDASKQQRARLLELRGYLRLELGDRRGALEDLGASVALWPVAANGAGPALKRLASP